MNYKQTLDNIAERIEYIICKYEAELIPTEDYGWVNRRYSNDKFRLAHIEGYSEKNLEVLHVTCFQMKNTNILFLDLILYVRIKNHWRHLWTGVLLIVH